LSGNEFARRIGISQSKVSRAELGQRVPTAEDVQLWARGTGASDAELRDLLERREQAAVEVVAWRRHLKRGLVALQQETAAVEASAGTIRYYHPSLVPGILQTPAYARALLEAGWPQGREDLPQAIAARMNRQAILYDEAKRFEFVIGEPALRWWFGSREVMLGQVDRLSQVSTLPNVTLGILPLHQVVSVWRSHHLTIYIDREDGPLVHVELLAGGQNYRDPDDVTRYLDAFDRLAKVAVTGDEARALLERVAADLRAIH
jgi:transcriptional regulator with XRE-family HTH domain